MDVILLFSLNYYILKRMELEKLFNPSSIAIVGVSQEKGKVGNTLAKNILELGYQGRVFLVNPKYQELFGRKCHSKLEEIGETVDVAIIAIPVKFVVETIKNASDKVKNFVIISAGFSEIGEEGAQREKELLKLIQEKNLNILGPNCLGFIIPKLNLNASFAGGIPKQGNISFVSQSGALISAILDISIKENFGFSNIISIGNKMQISESDLFEYLEKDSETKVVGMYIEGIKDGEKFKNLASKLSKTKPVVILKAGRTEKAKQAISSHTGALAGSEAIIDALFKKTGIIQAENFSEFLNILRLISITNIPLNEKAAVITNAGGPGVLTTDAFREKEIKMADFSQETKNKLRNFLPQESSVQNPIDLLGDAQEDRYEKILDAIAQSNEAGSVVVLLTAQENTPVEKIAEKIVEFKNKNSVPIIAVFLGGEKVKSSVDLLNESGIVNFYSPEEAIDSLNKYYLWKKRGEILKNADNFPSIDENRAANVERIIQNAKKEKRSALFFSEAKEIMDMYGIETVPYQEVTSDSVLELDFPLVLKVDSDKVLHKTDKQGLILNIKSEEELRAAYEKISVNFPKEKIIIQPMEEVKTELILGIKKDETAGSVVVFGLGGIYTEIFRMVDFVIPPAGLSEIRSIVLKSPIRFLFEENRGQKAYDIDIFSKIIQKLSLVAQEAEEIKELDINPLLVYNDERRALAADVKIII